jgi:cell division protein FtsW (lipid II flippase)
MTDDVSQYLSTGRPGGNTSGWWAGSALFAALMLIMVGVWQAVVGLIAILENDFYVATRNYVFEFDATTWGWVHLVVGLVVAFAGWGLLSGQTWARVVGITLAALSATANFLFIPIWALAAHGRELKE